VLLTRSPLVYPRRGLTARLACVKHAASVRPEPGSNSPLKSCGCSPRREPRFGVSRQELASRRDAGLTKGTVDRKGTNPSLLSTGRYCHSSTFGTLLSSQGSSAHRLTTLRLCSGATWSNLPACSDSVKLVPERSGPAQPDSTLESRTRQATSVEMSSLGVTRGRPPGPSALRPAAPWRRTELYGATTGNANRFSRAPDHMHVCAGQRRFGEIR
jgi:hypothetical protein